MRYLTLDEVLVLHERIIVQSGGSSGVRDLEALDSSIVQPYMSFGGQELYPTLTDKAAALCFSLVMNHPFVDGNKRIGHAAMETFLVLNNHELQGDVADHEATILSLAASTLGRKEFTDWVFSHIVPRQSDRT